MAAGAQRGRRTGDGGAAAVRAAPARTRCNPFFMRYGSDAGGERPLVCELQPEPRHAPSGASAARGLQRSPCVNPLRCVGLCRRAAASSAPPFPLPLVAAATPLSVRKMWRRQWRRTPSSSDGEAGPEGIRAASTLCNGAECVKRRAGTRMRAKAQGSAHRVGVGWEGPGGARGGLPTYALRYQTRGTEGGVWQEQMEDLVPPVSCRP